VQILCSEAVGARDGSTADGRTERYWVLRMFGADSALGKFYEAH
jgi:hypothetical protein